MQKITVGVKSSLASKVNWTQLVAALAMLLTMFGIDMPVETQAAVVSLIVAAQSFVTWVLRTWFTTSLTEASASRLEDLMMRAKEKL